MNNTPEFCLLTCLARTTLNSDYNARAADLLRGELQWDKFLTLCWRHGLMPLVFSHLLTTFAEFAPPTRRRKIREDFQHNAARNVILAAELCSVLEDFEERAIEALAYKGPAMAIQVYGDLSLRSFVDLDLLIRSHDAALAGSVLTARGYHPHLDLTPAQELMLFRSECDRVYLREGRNIVLELHWAVAPPFFGVKVDIEQVMADCAQIEMCGRKIKVPSAEMLLLLLCVNGTKDLWTVLEPVCSLNELVRRTPQLNWARVITLGREAGVLRMLHLGLSLARDIFDLHLPEQITASIAADQRVTQLASEARRRLTESEMPLPGLIEKTSFRVRSREHTRDKLRYCALRALTPTYRDCSTELPASLSFLYYGFRPLRLLRDSLKRPADRAVV